MKYYARLHFCDLPIPRTFRQQHGGRQGLDEFPLNTEKSIGTNYHNDKSHGEEYRPNLASDHRRNQASASNVPLQSPSFQTATTRLPTLSSHYTLHTMAHQGTTQMKFSFSQTTRSCFVPSRAA